MHRYFIKAPWWLKKIYPVFTWNFPRDEPSVYLSFDDGPHPEVTPWVLEQLRIAGAKASFFCIGENVLRYPETYRQIIEEGHAVGNHTQHHLDGWRCEDDVYLNDVRTAAASIDSNLFRPPYGKIKKTQAKKISAAMETEARIVMWDVLTGDFDLNYSGGECIAHVKKFVQAGSIIVFHDSEKAFRNLREALPETIAFLQSKNYAMKKIEMKKRGMV